MLRKLYVCIWRLDANTQTYCLHIYVETADILTLLQILHVKCTKMFVVLFYAKLQNKREAGEHTITVPKPKTTKTVSFLCCF